MYEPYLKPRAGKPVAPEGFWPELVYGVTLTLVNIGDSKPVRARKQLEARIASPVDDGARFVPVISRKGGVGATTVTTLLGMALAEVRDDRVLAVDANPDRGTLAERVTEPSTASVRDVVEQARGIRSADDMDDLVGHDRDEPRRARLRRRSGAVAPVRRRRLQRGRRCRGAVLLGRADRRRERRSGTGHAGGPAARRRPGHRVRRQRRGGAARLGDHRLARGERHWPTSRRTRSSRSTRRPRGRCSTTSRRSRRTSSRGCATSCGSRTTRSSSRERPCVSAPCARYTRDSARDLAALVMDGVTGDEDRDRGPPQRTAPHDRAADPALRRSGPPLGVRPGDGCARRSSHRRPRRGPRGHRHPARPCRRRRSPDRRRPAGFQLQRRRRGRVRDQSRPRGRGRAGARRRGLPLGSRLLLPAVAVSACAG